jgi:3-hydroxyisobutyrate dehydrogenase-like beta-hydroxyacid dehydrogenase
MITCDDTVAERRRSGAGRASELKVTLIGLGEAGRIYASGLASLGYEVRAHDPYTVYENAAVLQLPDLAKAVQNAEIVISLVGAAASEAVAHEALPSMPPGSVFADLNTASPATKRILEDVALTHGVLFADVAVLAPVPRSGVHTPLMASGNGADPLTVTLSGSGIPIESIGGRAGDSATRKLLRSIFTKGLAALVFESLEAADAAGGTATGWLHDQIAAALGPYGKATIDRLLEGSQTHARRRLHEAVDARDQAVSLGAFNWMSSATVEWFRVLEGRLA